MVLNKNHWYDGWFYDRIIAPNQDKLFSKLVALIEPNKKIIDIGCGTGRLAFALAGRSNSVLGIDLSGRNIERALLNLNQNPDNKITFSHSNLSEIINQGQTRFDYAILTYVIHEVEENERIKLLKEIATIADKIIIGDYIVPQPKSLGGILTELIEFIAGSDHYMNFKTFLANGGIYYLAKKAGLKVLDDQLNHESGNQLVILARDDSFGSF